MKKPVRLLLLAAGLFFAGVMLVFALAFNSRVQTWAARKALDRQVGLKAKLGQLSAGFQTIAVENAEWEQDGAVIKMPALRAELSVVDAGLREKISVRRLVAKGWTMDLSGYKFPAAPSNTPARPASATVPASVVAQVFQGVFAQASLPFDLTLDGVELDGEVTWPAASGLAAGKARVSLTGGGLGVGREGALAFSVVATLKGEGVPVDALTVSGRFVAAMDTPRTFARLATQAQAVATGAQFPQGVTLTADLAATRAASGENYFISLSDGARLLAALKLELPFASRHLAGTWKLDLRDTDLSGVTLGRPLPMFGLVGEGNLDVETVTGEVRATGKLNVAADRLGVIQPELAALGSVKLSADFDLARRGDSLRVERLMAALAGAQPVASVQSLQAFEFHPRSGELKVADPDSHLLSLSLHGLPLAWVQPLVKELAFSGGNVRGDFVAMARNGGFALRTMSPLTVDGISVKQAATPMINAVDLSLSAAADYTPQGWQVELTPLTAKSGVRSLFTLEAKAGQLRGKDQPIKTAGKFAVNLPAALGQPAVAGVVALTSGNATGEFVASFGDKREIQAKLTLTDLAVDPAVTKEKIPSLHADLRADIAATGVISFDFPLLIERTGRKSDLTVVGTVTPGQAGIAVDARATSTLLVVDDVQVLSAPFVSAPAATPSVATAPRAAAPPWAGIRGQITLALKQIAYSDTFQVNDVAGTIRLEDGAAKLVNFRAGLGEGAEAKVNGGVTFDATSPTPFALTADLAVSDFDPGSLFRALNPGQPPTVEGKFSVASRLFGRAAALSELGQTAQGDFRLASRGGVFRGLPVNYSAKVESAGKIAAGAAAIGNLLGSVTGKKDYADIAGKAQAVAEFTKTLAAIPYDQLSVVFTRDAAMTSTLKDFSLISPELRLSGVGQIAGQAETALLAQSLAMELKLRARGRTADLLKYLGKLDATPDELGYAACTLPLKVAGTMGRPDTDELNRAIANLALEKSGVTDKASELLNKLLGGGK